MSISGLNHYTIRCAPEDLPPLVDFYTKHLELTPGDRPVMPFPGYWLYSQGQAVVHLFACLPKGQPGPTGPLDHISFRAHGLAQKRGLLRESGIAFDEMVMPGSPLHMVFMHDPMGLKIELTYDLNEEMGKADAASA